MLDCYFENHQASRIIFWALQSLLKEEVWRCTGGWCRIGEDGSHWFIYALGKGWAWKDGMEHGMEAWSGAWEDTALAEGGHPITRIGDSHWELNEPSTRTQWTQRTQANMNRWMGM